MKPLPGFCRVLSVVHGMSPKYVACSQMVKHRVTTDAACPLLGIGPRKMKTYAPVNTCT